MTNWRVLLRPAAQKDLRNLDEGPQRDAVELLEDLTEDPLSVPAITMRAYPPGTMRARFHHDRYRMIYQISKPERRVLVLRIRPRPTAYSGMKH